MMMMRMKSEDKCGCRRKVFGWIEVAEKDPAPAIGHSPPPALANLHLLVHCCTKTSGESRKENGAGGD